MRTVSLAGAVALAAMLCACSASETDVRDTREPDAVGTVVSVEAGAGTFDVEFAPDAGYEYFDGTTFAFAEGGALESATGEALTASDLAVGDHLEVWVESCAESFPVQCPDPVGRLVP
ncbi:hypothetical protein [Demequina lignilytica]|uniref:DUF5666 domain-containing protein n=1 Tax=Demequina lignilytica TaxID=3051663 RepID=A0AB35MFQ0_9MICO|nr:hypothetical protein [Demequina sp. SYSU T0a273]MDN4482588.1 hypothetical protein [Demequina sp. SYSU T0a273]